MAGGLLCPVHHWPPLAGILVCKEWLNSMAGAEGKGNEHACAVGTAKSLNL